MKFAWVNRLLGLCLSLLSLNAATAQTQAETPAPPSADQQILVLLRAPPPHFRPDTNYSDSYGDGPERSVRRRQASERAHAHGLTLVDDWPLPLVGLDCYVMAVPAGQSVETAAASLSHDPGVAWAEPMHVYKAQGHTPPPAPNDPLYRLQPAAREWRLGDLHELATGRNIRVAVIDSQVEVNHPDLAGQVGWSENFVDDRAAAAELHGTGIAGVIAARADNGIGIAGVAPHAHLMALRACWQQGGSPTTAPTTTCSSLSLAKALHFAIVHDAQVVNMSLSGPPDLLLGKLLDAALARGITVVSAFDRSLPAGGFPASHPGVIAVSDEPAAELPPGVYSAPGRDIPTTQPGGRWYLVNGSSYAAAHVSGLFALIRQRSPSAQSAAALVTTAPGGLIDACASLMRAAGPCDCACLATRGSPSLIDR